MALNLEDMVGSTYFFGILVLFLVMYGPRLSPKLPESIRNLFNSQAFRALVMFLVIFNSNRELGMVMSLVIVIIFMVIMNILQTSNLLETVKNEHFTSSTWGPSPLDCATYDMEQAKFLGQAFYPLSERVNTLNEPIYNSQTINYDNIIQDNSPIKALEESEKNVSKVVNDYKTMF
jgi:hypothetical protein